MIHDPLAYAIDGFVVIAMIGLLGDWLDSKALRLKKGELIPQRWVIWAKREAIDKKTGLHFEYYVLMIRLPSYAWDYRINTDDYGWMQNAWFWYSRRPCEDAWCPPKGFSRHRISPIGRRIPTERPA